MKRLIVSAVVLGFCCICSWAQSYSITWYKIAGGGGTSTNGQYSVTGTIGQPDAGPAMTGGSYVLQGGFWAFISVLQTPGAPMLYISHAGSTVTIYWQNVAGWSLYQNSDLNVPAGWIPDAGAGLINGTNYLNFSAPKGNLYFRLQQ